MIRLRTYIATGFVLLTVEGCTVPCIDAVFVLDVSLSINNMNSKLMKIFVLSIINLMNISAECSRAGVILFARDAWINFSLEEHLTPTTLQNAIDQIKYAEISDHNRTFTNTPAALRLLQTAGAKNGALGLRDGKIHIAVFITDGETLLRDNIIQNEADKETKIAGNKLREARIYDQIYAVGVGIKGNHTTLRYIANPLSLAFSLAKFNQSLFNQLTTNISRKLCDGK